MYLHVSCHVIYRALPSQRLRHSGWAGFVTTSIDSFPHQSYTALQVAWQFWEYLNFGWTNKRREHCIIKNGDAIVLTWRKFQILTDCQETCKSVKTNREGIGVGHCVLGRTLDTIVYPNYPTVEVGTLPTSISALVYICIYTRETVATDAEEICNSKSK